MADGPATFHFEVLLPADGVQAAVRSIAARIAPVVEAETVVVCLLTGSLWFAADLMRELAALGRHPLFDALWLASYGDARESAGEVEVRGGFQRPVAGRDVLILDDVLETGLSLQHARRLALSAGALSVRTAVFARKPRPGGARSEADFVAWDAPARFLVGYGMDHGGRYRGLAHVAALD